MRGGGPVPFRGDRSDVMIIGEAPGRVEDDVGQPFIGPAGKLLWDTLAKCGVTENECFVANAVCCWPGRTPKPEEIRACSTNLRDQITWCKPTLILALGVVANMALGKSDRPIAEYRGRWYTYSQARKTLHVFPTIHPAAVLRNRTLKRGWRLDLEKFADAAVG